MPLRNNLILENNMLKETLLECIISSDKSLNAISIGSNVDYGTLHRFVRNERQIQINIVQRLCDYFGLEFCFNERRMIEVIVKASMSLIHDLPRIFRHSNGKPNKKALRSHLMATCGIQENEMIKLDKQVACSIELLSVKRKEELIAAALELI